MLRLFFALLLLPAIVSGADKPAVLLITVDGFGWGDLSLSGNAQVPTPRLDKLFGQSAVFRDFHVSPLEAPSRAALLTGQYPERAGVWGNHSGRNRLRAGVETIAARFRAADNPAALYGTWALGDVFPSRPLDHGYIESVIHPGGLPGSAADFYSNDGEDDYWLINGEIAQRAGSSLRVVSGAAARFIAKNAASGFLCHVAPSLPTGMPESATQAFKGRPEIVNPVRAAWIAELDSSVGEMLDQLDQSGLADRAIVIFTSTCGMPGAVPPAKPGFNAGRRGHRGSPYDGGHCVPLAVRFPAGAVKPGPISGLAAHVDLLPTVMELAGIPGAAENRQDGISLVPAMKGEAGLPDRTMVTQAQEIPVPVQWRLHCVMSGPWRLVNGRELYDLRTDPGERRDLAASNEEQVKTMRAAAEAWWADVNPASLEPVRMVVGGAQDPVLLTPIDWTGRSAAPFTKEDVIAGRPANGTWALTVAAEGKYDILLRRWPLTVDRPLADGFFVPEKARIRLGTVDAAKDVPADATGVDFRVALKAGPVSLQTWLSGKDKSSGAYFVEIRRAIEIRAAKPIPEPVDPVRKSVDPVRK